MSEEKFTFNLGYVESVTFSRHENGRMVTYGYSIKRDRDGAETSRTEPIALGSIGYDNGKDFTENDYNALNDRSN